MSDKIPNDPERPLCHYWAGGHGSGPACGADAKGSFYATEKLSIVNCDACKASVEYGTAVRQEGAPEAPQTPEEPDRLVPWAVVEKSLRKLLDEALHRSDEEDRTAEAFEAERDELRATLEQAAKDIRALQKSLREETHKRQKAVDEAQARQEAAEKKWRAASEQWQQSEALRAQALDALGPCVEAGSAGYEALREIQRRLRGEA